MTLTDDADRRRVTVALSLVLVAAGLVLALGYVWLHLAVLPSRRDLQAPAALHDVAGVREARR